MAYKNTCIKIKSFPLDEEYNEKLQELASAEGISQTRKLSKIVMDAIDNEIEAYEANLAQFAKELDKKE